MPKITLYNGDCVTVMKTFPDKSVDLVITSPPYNIQNSKVSGGKDKGYHDDRDDYYEFLKTSVDQMLRITKKWVFFNIQALSNNRKDLFRFIGNYHDRIKEVIIWNKTIFQPAMNHSVLSSAFEFIFVMSDSDTELRKFEGVDFTVRGVSNVWTGTNNSGGRDSFNCDTHAAIMPLWIPRKILSLFSKPGNVILDPFCGLGTTMKASIEAGLNGVGIELSEEYCSLAIERLRPLVTQRTLTGESRELIYIRDNKETLYISNKGDTNQH